jgi:hypothetical protein
MAIKIKLYEYLGIDTLRHRDSAKTVLDGLVNTPLHDKITIDFSGISFASRSFCHELRRGLNGREAVFNNMLPEVEKMMQIAFAKPQISLKATGDSKKLEELIPRQVG